MPSQKRRDRPRTFYPIAVSRWEPSPFSWKRTLRRTVSLPLREVPKPQREDSIVISRVSRPIIAGMKKTRKATTLRASGVRYQGIGDADNQAILLAIQLIARQI